VIAWNDIRPGLLNIIKQISGIETVWKDQPQGYVPPTVSYGAPVTTLGTICKLAIGPTSGRGLADELRTEIEGNELHDTVIGVRLFTLKILIECFDQKDGKTADHYLEQIRSRFAFRSTKKLLRAINVAYVSSGDIIDLSPIRDNRAVSIFNLDIRFSCLAIDEDPTAETYIETVEPLVQS
jgi:hypothetical protein